MLTIGLRGFISIVKRHSQIDLEIGDFVQVESIINLYCEDKTGVKVLFQWDRHILRWKCKYWRIDVDVLDVYLYIDRCFPVIWKYGQLVAKLSFQ